MARLNEPALSTAESIEILRKKMLRQNRELAKSNNSHNVRVRDLELELNQARKENLELRSRIIELEHEAQENGSRRMLDHTLAIKDKLVAQLAEFGTLVAGLGLEPPIKQYLPQITTTAQQTTSFVGFRLSPSQRRLRDVANDVEQLGNIAEHKALSRQSMSPEQIQALKSEADDEEAPELPSPAPVDDREPAKTDTPPRESRARNFSSSFESSPLVVSSPDLDKLRIGSASSANIMTPMIRESRVHVDPTPDTPIAPPTKAGSKRKFNRDRYEPMTMEKITDENLAPQAHAEGVSFLNKTRGKTLRELANERREAARATAEANPRMPLAAKSTNDDVQSPKKRKTTPNDKDPLNDKGIDKITSKRTFLLTRDERRRAQEAQAQEAQTEEGQEAAPQETRAQEARIEPSLEGLKGIEKIIAKNRSIVNRDERRRAQEAQAQEDALAQERLAQEARCERHKKVIAAREAAKFLDTVATEQAQRFSPPADVGSLVEVSRPSRRSRASISYAEPSLKDKLRRPRNETFDAVSGESAYVTRRRSMIV